MFLSQEIKTYLITFYSHLVDVFFSIHILSDEQEKVTVGVSLLPILWKILPQSHLIIMTECYILKYFSNFTLILFTFIYLVLIFFFNPKNLSL